MDPLEAASFEGLGLPTELAIILVLVLLNGIFAGAEIAILTLRRGQLERLLETSPRRARWVAALRSQTERFLATVQVGITVVGATAAAFGGSAMTARLTALIARAPALAPIAEDLALAAIVALISYLSLVLGELVPKSIALRHPEGYALLAGRPLFVLSVLARPLVWILTQSSNVVLRPFGDRATFSESRLSPEELRQLVEEAARSGDLDQRSGEIASRALELGGLTAADLMVPRARITAVPRDAPPAKIKQLLLESGYSRMPVYDGAIDNVVGYVTAKDILALDWERQLIVLDDILRPPLFLLKSAKAPRVLRELQAGRSGLAFVVGEHGELLGLLTMEDVIEELVGEILTEDETREEMLVREEGGAARVRGDALVREVNRELPASLPEDDRWSTVAGLCIELAGRIPEKGARLKTDTGWRIDVLDASPRRVRLVRIARDDDPGSSLAGRVADAHGAAASRSP
ncbi:MAG TPA: hemolysin family protein [Candidatus Binatia bacterium]|nr:hemolysin family protein [Candidatus Binatia bacterium]